MDTSALEILSKDKKIDIHEESFLSTELSNYLNEFNHIAPSQSPILSTSTDLILSIPGIEKPIFIHQDAMPGCGGRLWPAGEMLAEYVSWRTNSFGLNENWKGKNVLELGSGLGIVGLATRYIKSISKVILTDQECLIPLLQHNVDLNFKNSDGILVKTLSWGEPIPSIILQEFGLNNKIDIILAADCIYLEMTFPLLITTLLDLFNLSNTDNDGDSPLILFSFKKRRKADKRFWIEAKKRGLFYNEITRDKLHSSTSIPWDVEKWTKKGVFLYQVMKKKDIKEVV